MKGQVSTPSSVVDIMVEKLFSGRSPKPNDTVLDPGCGDGPFIKGILHWSGNNRIQPPKIVGVESDPKLLARAQESFKDYENVMLLNQDFLLEEFGTHDFIIGNPPYVRIEKLSESEKDAYRNRFETAKNRFDLYILFFEKALGCLAPYGRLVFITPEKFEYTLTAKPLRKLMTDYHVAEIHHLPEDAFKGLVAYPAITTIDNTSRGKTKIVYRNGLSANVMLPRAGSSWISAIQKETIPLESKVTLGDICKRISAGVATGKDRIFVLPKEEVPRNLESFAYPTVSGGQLTAEGIKVYDKILVPYDRSGKLLTESRLGEFRQWLYKHRNALESRYCVQKGNRRWYAFHENPPLIDILKPKILCRDIAKKPMFWFDKEGSIVPRHSVYYIIPKDQKILPRLLDYLNSEKVHKWLLIHCQRAANNFIRLQSNVLKKLPITQDLSP